MNTFLFFRAHTGIPTYGELVQYAQKKQYMLSEETICIDTNICKDESVLLSDVAIKEITYVTQFNLYLSSIFHYYLHYINVYFFFNHF